MKTILHKRISSLKAYTVPEVYEGEIKLDAQENPYSLPPEVRKKIGKVFNGIKLNRYPDPQYKKLKKLIGEYCGISSENILVGNGSDELILMLLIACGGQSRVVSCPSPTFSMYEILSRLTGTRYVSIPMGDNFEIPAEKILSANPDIVFIAYPNNPTGNCFNREKIEKIINHCKGLVVIDEAYYEFSQRTYIREIDKYENLVVLRTFSKAFSLAGIRAGYIAGNVNLIMQYRKAQLPYNLSIVNQKILEVIMEEREEILSTVEKLISSRDRMYEELKHIEGIIPYPSDANFILMKIKKIKRVLNVLKKNNIKVREFSSQDLKDYLRVTIGTVEENDNFIKALRKREAI